MVRSETRRHIPPLPLGHLHATGVRVPSGGYSSSRSAASRPLCQGHFTASLTGLMFPSTPSRYGIHLRFGTGSPSGGACVEPLAGSHNLGRNSPGTPFTLPPGQVVRTATHVSRVRNPTVGTMAPSTSTTRRHSLHGTPPAQPTPSIGTLNA